VASPVAFVAVLTALVRLEYLAQGMRSAFFSWPHPQQEIGLMFHRVEVLLVQFPWSFYDPDFQPMIMSFYDASTLARSFQP
jgi:hypothetical protein